MEIKRTPAKKKAKELAKLLRAEHPDYHYLKSVFRELRRELEVDVPRTPKRLPDVPTEEELRAFYQEVWHCRKFSDLVLIKTLFYTGVRVSELVNIRLEDVDLERCQIRIHREKARKTASRLFPLHSVNCLGCTCPRCARRRLPTSLNPLADASTVIEEYEKCWPAMQQPRALPVPSRRTSGGTFCSPGSRSRALMMPWSSPTLIMKVASRSKSILACLLLPLKRCTSKR